MFETAPNNGGVPGAYTERFRDTWAAAVNATGLKVEIKAGTSGAEAAPGPPTGTTCWSRRTASKSAGRGSRVAVRPVEPAEVTTSGLLFWRRGPD